MQAGRAKASLNRLKPINERGPETRVLAGGIDRLRARATNHPIAISKRDDCLTTTFCKLSPEHSARQQPGHRVPGEDFVSQAHRLYL